MVPWCHGAKNESRKAEMLEVGQLQAETIGRPGLLLMDLTEHVDF